MKYEKDLIEQVINEYYSLFEITKNISYTGKIKKNKILFNEINNKYPNMFKNIGEILYLKDHSIDNKFCKCGKCKTFINYKNGYRPYCSSKCATNSPEYIKKREETILKRFGTRRISDSEYMKNKFKDPEWGKMCSEKARKTYKEKTGFDCPFDNPEVKEKTKETNLRKYGVEHHWQSKDPKLNGKSTRLKKYGYANFFQVPWVIEKCNKSKSSEQCKKRKSDSIKKAAKERFKKEHLHFQDYNAEYFRDNFIVDGKFDVQKCCDYFGISYHWALYKKNSFGITCDNTTNVNNLFIKQNALYDFIKSVYEGTILLNDRKVIAPLELDIYLPEKNLALEFNGLYWHSTMQKEKNYHQLKSMMCKEKGIRLIHIWEDEWDDEKKQKIIKDIILHALNLKKENKIYARKCIIKELDNEAYNKFCNENHIQGTKGAQVKLGLFYGNELVQIASFGKSRYDKQYEWEWIRGCPASNNNVIGGTSKLFKHFVRTYNPKSVLCYADFNKFDGRGYEECGFRFNKITAPDKFFYDLTNNKRVNRSPKKYQEYKKKVESGEFYAIYGAGNLKFIWKSPLK